MKAYYILGHNVAWLNGICLILFVIGVVGALAMVAIPEKFNLRVNRGDTFIYCALIAVVGFSGMFVISIHSFSMDELEAGRHWKDDCRTLEVNMPTGAFTSPVNKLDCDGTMERQQEIGQQFGFLIVLLLIVLTGYFFCAVY